MKKRIILKRGIAYLLTVAMVVGLVTYAPYSISTVQAEETTTSTTGKTIAGLGTGVIADPTVPTSTGAAWQGSYVYFGTYGTDDDGNLKSVKYRVLDSKTTVFGGTTMLLDCDTILWKGSDPSSAFDTSDNMTNVWANSTIRTYLNGTFLTDNFSIAEQNAIASSTKSAADSSDGSGWSSLFYASLSGDKIFFLDAKEATNTTYGYSNTDLSATNRVKTGGNAYWWLRSADTDDSYIAGFVHSNGNFNINYVSIAYVGVSPALNINLSSVLFSSVISGTARETGAEYKLTIVDDKMTIGANGNPTRSGDTVSIPYTISGDNSGNVSQVSILLTDKAYTESDAQILHYGSLDISAGNGTGTFTVPTDLSEKVCGTDYYAYIIAEDVNGTYETDYASTPLSITIPEKPWEAPTVPTINIGTDNFISPAKPSSPDDAWKGCYVYYGTYNGSPVKYRVLDSNTTVFGGTTMLLDCDSVLWAGSDPSSAFDADSNVWADSDIRAYLNGTFLTDNFSAAEQNAITSSTKSSADSNDGAGWLYLNYAELNNDKIFFLDAKEATNTSYGYSNTKSSATNRKKTGGNAYWWLRSATSDISNSAGSVNSVGNISYGSVINIVGVSPALNVNLSSVLFTSASGTSKSSALTAQSSQTGTTTGTEWKLTLQDAGKTVKITDNEKVIKVADGTITVPYTYTDTATSDSEKVNQISVMITDKEYTESDAEILYYGALQGTSFSDGGATGTGTFALPSSLTGTLGTDYHVYILAEHVNDDNATDYASAPVEITSICDEVSSVAITDIDTPSSGNALDTTATVASNATASVKWYLGDTEVTGTAGYNKAYTVKVTLTADSDYAFTKDTTVTLNGTAVTATKNADGTLTVSHTFDATGMGIITYTSTGYEGTYDGQAHGITVTVSDPTYVTITYSTDEGDNKTYSDTNPTFTDAGEYTVYYKIEKNDYTTITGSQTVNIAKREITITADDQSITWGSNISRTAYTITSGSLVDGEIILTLIPSTLDLTTDGTILVGGVRIKKYTASSAEDLTDNYTVTKVSGKLIITHNTTLAPTAITATKETTTYIAGQSLNVDDIIVSATYADGYSEKVTGYTTNADSIDMNTAGDKTLTISYTANGGTVTTDIDILVTPGYSVTLPATQTGYTITASTSEALWNGNVKFTFTLADGYSKTGAFAVLVNGNEVTMNDEGVYTATGVKETLVVKVEGVVDTTPPTAEIKIKDNGCTQFLNTITFGIFFKETQDVTITASDVNTGSGINKIYYYISNEALTEDEIKALDETSWAEYNNKFSINPDNTYVIYAKVVDKAGNTTYISTDGLVLDGTAPVITGIEDNGVYYKEVTFSVVDAYLDKVLVDDEEITLTDGKYTVYADDKAHIIKATDRAGNEIVYTITVRKYGIIAYTATGADVTYDGKAYGITVSVTDPADAKVTYSADEVSYSETNPIFTDVNGDGVMVYYRIEKDNYITAEGSETVKIGKKELTITASDQTITYGDDIDTSKYTVSGLLDGHSINAVTLTPSTTEVADNGTMMLSGAKIVNAAGEDVTANYDITYVAGTLVIEKAKNTEPEPEPVEYEITDGANSKWTVNSDGSIAFTGNGDYAKFVGVKVDGAFIDEANYTVKAGSTIITLKNSYLNTLSVGTHTFEIVWTDGSASTIFTVEAVVVDDSVIPDTGDNIPIGLCLIFLIGSGLTAVGFWKKKKYIVEE